uniref:Uncharacterized protein n=1 Tax=Solanum lycopersicum TaxID=4081 RepID=A0A3Q7ENH9_SOLLC
MMDVRSFWVSGRHLLSAKKN